MNACAHKGGPEKSAEHLRNFQTNYDQARELHQRIKYLVSVCTDALGGSTVSYANQLGLLSCQESLLKTPTGPSSSVSDPIVHLSLLQILQQLHPLPNSCNIPVRKVAQLPIKRKGWSVICIGLMPLPCQIL